MSSTNGTGTETAARVTLDDLAKRRRHVTHAIVTLASFYQLDPAPWLDVPAFVQVDVTVPGGGVAPTATATTTDDTARARGRRKAKRRPQRPASHATNGTGRAHKVDQDSLGPTTALVLRALTKDPQSPKSLGQQINLPAGTVGYHLKKLAAAKLAQLSGVGKGRKAQLRA